MQAQKPKTYYDEEWFLAYRKIHSFARKRVIDNSPKIKIDHKNKKLLIEHKLEKLNSIQKRKLISKLKRKLRKIDTLRIKLFEEKNEFIQNFYLEKLREEESFTEQIISRLENPENNKEIYKFINEQYTTPSSLEFKKFLNEFIFFLKEIGNYKNINSETKKLIKEITNENFLNHKYLKPKDINNWTFKILKDENLYKILSLNEILKLIKIELKNLNLQRKIKLRLDNRNIFSVSALNKRLNIPKNLKLTFKRTKEIIEHEIKVHLVRAINGESYIDQRSNGFRLLSINSKESLKLEEGLATFYEQNHFRKSNKYDLTQLYIYYIRLIAIHLAKNFKPYFVYLKVLRLYELQKQLFIKDNINPEKSAKLLMQRIYADFPEPQKAYFNPRICIYLLGNRKIWELKEKGFDISKLMIGKVSVEDLEIIH